MDGSRNCYLYIEMQLKALQTKFIILEKADKNILVAGTESPITKISNDYQELEV